MPGIDIYDDSYVEVVSDPGVDKAKLVLKNELENQVNTVLTVKPQRSFVHKSGFSVYDTWYR